jgi:tRNA pseudouridine55 synthase
MEQGIILPLDKPYGWSSFDAVRYVQRQIKQRLGLPKFKIGHAGTLDPLATGVLLLCLGKATRQVESLQSERKEYLAVVRLGAITPSYDLETQPAEPLPCQHIAQAQVETVLQQMTGEQEQMPPAFSAKNINGKRAYELARKGTDVALHPNTIHIYNIRLLKFALPFVELQIECSKGTYIRALARDIGVHLGCGAYLASLRRTASGAYNSSALVNIDEIFG